MALRPLGVDGFGCSGTGPGALDPRPGSARRRGVAQPMARATELGLKARGPGKQSGLPKVYKTNPFLVEGVKTLENQKTMFLKIGN